jgi:hypothetical protein
MPIYAALGVPELWRLKAERLTFYRLGRGKKYVSMTVSVSFPGLPSSVLQSAVGQLGSIPENAIVRQFISWLREHNPNGVS